jgi:molybdopterin/thiamine biosynthesis adenylyltransferase
MKFILTIMLLQETGELTEALIKDHSVVVLTNSSLEEQRRVNAMTHEAGIGFIVADVRGLYAQVIIKLILECRWTIFLDTDFLCRGNTVSSWNNVN